MTDSRCHRCDRAECPAWTAPDPQTDAELFALGDAERDCDRHAISPEQWRTRAIAAEQRAEAAERGNRELCAAVAAVLSGMAMTRGQEWIRDRLRDAMERHAIAPAAESGKENDRG